MRTKVTVKVNLNNTIKNLHIRINEIDARDVSKDVKLNELRNLQYFLDGTLSVIEHTGQYIEEISQLLYMRRELFATIHKYL